MFLTRPQEVVAPGVPVAADRYTSIFRLALLSEAHSVQFAPSASMTHSAAVFRHAES